MQKSICKNSLWHSQNKYRLTMDSEQFIQSLLINIGIVITLIMKTDLRDFPGGAVVENLPANAGDTGSSPGLGRSHMPRSN